MSSNPSSSGSGLSFCARIAAALRRAGAWPLFWPLLTLALLLAGNGVFNPGFLSLRWQDGHLYGNLVDIANRAAPLAVVALGMTAVIAVRGLDISVGAVLAISATVAAWMVVKLTENGDAGLMPLWLAILAALGVALLCGAWNAMLVLKAGIQPIVATLVLMVAGRGIAQLLSGGQIITVYYESYSYLGSGFLFGLPFPLFVVAALFIGLYLLTERTALGLFVRSIGHNPQATHVAGVRARSITAAAYMLCALCAGVAGLLVSSNVSSADANNAGLMLELDAILAVCLGGTALTGGRFSLAGSVLGALIIQTLTSTIYAAGVPPQVNLVVKAALVFAVMLLQSAEFRGEVRKRFGRKSGAAA